ncbi:metallopeptidase family protein [Roseospira visakhapatnamensis]|uniref:Putative Zn-dependent protease with MMP-like domain n=1 Tax=Roseospira visakhapatnamensis TaxID=390880 RepID=A0A7W6RA29_9PROT|nr:metallopeptidase family protein [Roseospira visakhapatnamensis]MBB4264731.1 putative Zn-dependent protease with MMP-like domain [Roseospira visakhapatnamensis]
MRRRRSPFTRPPSPADIETVAREALASIPAALRRHVEGVVIHVEAFPDDETCAEMELDSPWDLLGLYRGVALPEKSVAHAPQDLDMIFLYREPILAYWCETGEDLTHLIRHVLIHEVGHHFGLSDDDMEAIEAQVDDEDDDRP